MNTLSFGIDIKGGTQAKQQLQEIIAMQAKLNRNNIVSGINPATVMRSPELLAELKRMTAATMRIPPIIPPPVIGGGRTPFNFMQLAAGSAMLRYHPFMASRELSAGFGQPFGKGPVGAGIFLAGLTVATVALTAAFHSLRTAVEEGSKLYQHSARLGLNTGKTFQLEALAKVMGLSPEQIDTLAIRGSHPQRGERQAFFRQGDVGTMLGSGAGANQLGGLQQIKNMGDYADRTFRSLVFATKDMAENAKAMQEYHFMIATLSLQFKSILVQVTTLLMPIFKKLAEDIFVIFAGISLYLRQFTELGAALGILPKGQPGTNRIQASRVGAGSIASPWERMGFVIGGFGRQDYAKRTAEKTTEMAGYMKAIVDHLRSPPGSRPGADPLATHTFYHKITPLP